MSTSKPEVVSHVPSPWETRGLLPVPGQPRLHSRTLSQQQTRQAWWHMPLSPALGRQRQEALCEFQASQGYSETLYQKKQTPKPTKQQNPNFQHPVSHTKNYISVSLGLRTLHCSMSGKSASENNLHPTLQACRCNKEWKSGCKKLMKGVCDFSLLETRNSVTIALVPLPHPFLEIVLLRQEGSGFCTADIIHWLAPWPDQSSAC